jgi:hypothetical protein
MNKDAERLLAGSPPPVGDLARRACDAVLAVFPRAVVTADDQNIGFATGPRYRDVVFVVTPQRAYVNLGFAFGVDLPDPAGLLAGTGKAHRHVKLRGPEDLARPELRALMAAAMERVKAH